MIALFMSIYFMNQIMGFKIICMFRILWYQVFAYANESYSVALRGLDELGHPTAGTFSITQRNGVKHACT